jgi:hypothetical protein
VLYSKLKVEAIPSIFKCCKCCDVTGICPDNSAGFPLNSRFQKVPSDKSAPTVRMNGQSVISVLQSLGFPTARWPFYFVVLQGSESACTQDLLLLTICYHYPSARHLTLLQFNQDTSTVFGMQEYNRLIMSSNLGFRIQCPNIFSCQVLNRCVDIINLGVKR